jgi:hypothetical protein
MRAARNGAVIWWHLPGSGPVCSSSWRWPRPVGWSAGPGDAAQSGSASRASRRTRELRTGDRPYPVPRVASSCSAAAWRWSRRVGAGSRPGAPSPDRLALAGSCSSAASGGIGEADLNICCLSRLGSLVRMGHVVHERQPVGPVARGYPGPLDAGLSGTRLVADDLYLLAHDDRTGKPLLPPRPLGTGAGRGATG